MRKKKQEKPLLDSGEDDEEDFFLAPVTSKKPVVDRSGMRNWELIYDPEAGTVLSLTPKGRWDLYNINESLEAFSPDTAFQNVQTRTVKVVKHFDGKPKIVSLTEAEWREMQEAKAEEKKRKEKGERNLCRMARSLDGEETKMMTS